MNSKNLLILGSGYTGQELYRRLDGQTKWTLTESSRSQPNKLLLDLEEPETWKLYKQFDACIWLAPSPPWAVVERFLVQNAPKLGRIILVSSTGFLKVNAPHARVDETSLIDFSISRAHSEEQIRCNYSAMIVHAAGIYGPGRSPKDWLKSGRVKASDKFLNVIHVEDLASFLILALDKFKPATRWVLSDGAPKTWAELYANWKEELNLPDCQITTSNDSKRVDPTKTFSDFQFNLRYKNIYEGLR